MSNGKCELFCLGNSNKKEKKTGKEIKIEKQGKLQLFLFCFLSATFVILNFYLRQNLSSFFFNVHNKHTTEKGKWKTFFFLLLAFFFVEKSNL